MSPPGEKAGRDDVNAEVALQLGFARRFAVSCGVPLERLDDFVQDVAVTALRRIHEGAFSPAPDKPLHEAVRHWLGGIVRFKALDLAREIAARDRVHRPTGEHPTDAGAHVPTPEAGFDAKEALATIGRLKMSPTQRQTVALAALGYSAREIGEQLGIPEDTAATHLKRARKAYQAAVGGQKGRRRKG